IAKVNICNAQAGVSCVRVLNIGDATVNLLNLGSHTRRTICAFAHCSWEVGAFAIPITRGSVQELLEVVRGTRLIRTVYHGNIGVRQLNAVILGSDCVIVPLSDVAGENLTQGLGAEVEGLINALQMVSDRNWTDNEWQVPCFITTTALSSCVYLVFFQWGVRTSEDDLTSYEIGTARA